jgi:hypothetical protein
MKLVHVGQIDAQLLLNHGNDILENNFGLARGIPGFVKFQVDCPDGWKEGCCDVYAVIVTHGSEAVAQVVAEMERLQDETHLNTLGAERLTVRELVDHGRK